MTGGSFGRLFFALLLPFFLTPPSYAAITNINPTQVPLQLRAAEVTVESYGGVAETLVKMRFHNPNPWRVGTEIDFRLANGCTISSFGFEMPDGLMHSGVAANCLQRRLFFDDLREAQRDVPLIQELRDAYHKFRIFPIEAGETREMEMRHIGDLLSFNADGTDLLYNMPLTWNMNDFSLNQPGLEAERPEVSFAFRMIVHGNQDTPYAIDKNGEKLFFTKSGDTHLFEYTFDSRGAEPYNAVFYTAVNVVVPGAGRSGGRVQNTDSGQYFYSTVNSGALASLIRSNDAPMPTHVGIAWDSSLSGLMRNHSEEFRFLDAYFDRLLSAEKVKEVRVSLLRFRNDAEKIREFVVDRSSGWENLRKELASTVYDGATNFCAARSELSLPADEWLFFSDGHENYGLHMERKRNAPVHTIAASPYSFTRRLHQFATTNGGVLLDLTQQSPSEAADFLRLPRARLVGMEGTGVADLLASSHTIGENEMIVISGRSTTQDQGWVKLTFAGAERSESAATLNIPVNGGASSPLASREWARMKINELFAGHVLIDTASVQRLGREFGVVSLATVLMIPPSGSAQLQALPVSQRMRQGVQAEVASEEGFWRNANGENLYPMERLRAEWTGMLDRMKNATDSSTEPGSLRSPFRMVNSEYLLSDALWEDSSGLLIPYGDGASYIERLRSAPQKKAYEVYLSEVSRYWRDPNFFLDTSYVLFEYGLPDLGLRVLSNLVELDSENKWILRTVAYRLTELGSPQARVMFEKILMLDEDDPQSYRDLAMICARDGDVGRAIELLYFVATHTWGDAYDGVQLAVLRDISIVTEGQNFQSEKEKIDPALQGLPPVDIRVMLAPDRDNADLQIRLADEKGNVIKDGLFPFVYAPGNGADELILPKAKSGRYFVQVGYADDRRREERIPSLALVSLITHAGTKLQSGWTKTVRLMPKQKGMSVAMEFDFDADQAAQHTEASRKASEQERNMMIAFGLLVAAAVAAVVFLVPGRRR